MEWHKSITENHRQRAQMWRGDGKTIQQIAQRFAKLNWTKPADNSCYTEDEVRALVTPREQSTA